MKTSNIFLLVLVGLLGLGLLFYLTPANLIDHETMTARVAATKAAANFGTLLNNARATAVPTIIVQEIAQKQAEIDKTNAEANAANAKANLNNAQAKLQTAQALDTNSNTVFKILLSCVAAGIIAVAIGLIIYMSRRNSAESPLQIRY